MAAPDLAEKVAYQLPEVAELTGVSLRRLKEGCREGEIPHTCYRGSRVMTRADIAAFLERFHAQAEAAAGDADPEVARIDEHRRRVAARLARRSGRAAA